MIINALGELGNPNADIDPADALLQTSDEIVVDERALATHEPQHRPQRVQNPSAYRTQHPKRDAPATSSPRKWHK
jgi:hypothetical protein